MSTTVSTIDNTPQLRNSDLVELGAKNFDLLKNMKAATDSFLAHSETIEVQRWNRLYPYQLVVCEIQNGKYVPTDMKFTLPMTPQDLSISTPFAISNTITAGGIAEEHNGVKVKSISFSGSLGSAPLRGSNDPYDVSPDGWAGVGRAIAGGTIQAAQNLAQSAQDLALGAKPRIIDNYIENYNNGVKPEIRSKYHSTGYVQHLLLDKFLQGYAALKTESGAKDYRLAFCIWKDDAVYLVTPVSYVIKRSASSPGEYMYDLQLKAWKRVTLEGVPTAAKETPPAKGYWNANRALTKLQEARTVIYKAKQTVQAVRGDADRLMNVVRETVLAARDAAGVAKTVLDMPAAIKSDYAILIKKQTKALEQDIKNVGKAAEKWKKVMDDVG
jgi:hypothetical protein